MSTQSSNVMPPVGHARRHILDVARAIFQAQGTHAVGLDSVAAEAGVPEKVVRRYFPTKDDLVCAGLREEDVRIRFAMAPCDVDPKVQIVGIFKVVAKMCREQGAQGCAFINAGIGYPDAAHPVRRVIAAHRRWFRGLLRDLLVAAGHPHADRAADMLVLLRDGLFIRGQFDSLEDPDALAREELTWILADLA